MPGGVTNLEEFRKLVDKSENAIKSINLIEGQTI